jgi:ubiquitin C-terminal hydrolase
MSQKDGEIILDNLIQDNNNDNDIMGNEFPDNNVPNDQPQMNNNDIMGNQFPDNNLPNNNLPPKNMSQNKNTQEINNENNEDNNLMNNSSEIGEMDLNNLHHEDELEENEYGNEENIENLNINNINNENNMDNLKTNDSEIDEIFEDLYIEEYNPSLGLSKIENPKYLNALIQCFAHLPEITDKMINLHNDPNFKDNLPNLRFTKRYRNLLINLFLPEKVFNMNKQPYNPAIFMNTIYELNPSFQNNQNIDFKEFIEFLIHQLHDDLNTKKSNVETSDTNSENINKKMEIKNENDILVEFLQSFTSNNNSLITKNLYGINKYTYYCHLCQSTFYNFKCYYYLYFDLKKVMEFKQNRFHREDVELKINDCFDYYQKAETLIGDKGLYCPSCKEQTESTSIKNLYSTKSYLIVILDRNIGDNFNDAKIEFKESLNLKDYVQYKKEEEKSKEKFFLGGIINYVADSYGNETYNAFIKMGKNNEWFCYNDETVYQIAFQDIKNTGYTVALFYHKAVQK